MEYDQPQPGQPQPVAYGQPPQPMVYSNQQPAHQGNPGAVAATGGTTVIIQQAVVKPSSYLALAVIVCIFCNIVLGLVAIILSVLSSSAADEGDMEGARVKGKISLGLSLGGIAMTVVSIIIVIVVLVVMVDDAVDDVDDWYNNNSNR